MFYLTTENGKSIEIGGKLTLSEIILIAKALDPDNWDKMTLTPKQELQPVMPYIPSFPPLCRNPFIPQKINDPIWLWDRNSAPYYTIDCTITPSESNTVTNVIANSTVSQWKA